LGSQASPQKITWINGYRIRYFDFNNNIGANILILLHGIGASAERWMKVALTLSKYFRVIIPDIIGFGYSDKPKKDYTIDFLTKFFLEFLNSLNICTPIIIIASSMGGYLAAVFALRFNNHLEKLILVSPAGTMRSVTPALAYYFTAARYPSYQRALKAFRRMVYDPSVVSDDSVRDFINRMRLPGAWFAFRSTFIEMTNSFIITNNSLSKLLIPTLLVWGERDNIIPIYYQKDFMKIQDCISVVIKDCGHVPFVEKPVEFNEIVLKFLI
jgi:2-hydroxy-6-oxonona-2,4-dienedioate hydrolase